MANITIKKSIKIRPKKIKLKQKQTQKHHTITHKITQKNTRKHRCLRTQKHSRTHPPTQSLGGICFFNNLSLWLFGAVHH